jgi:hypothetical protein
MATIPKRLRRWLEGLRFPYLLILMAILLVVSLVVPDPVPFADELLLLLGTLLLSRLKRKPPETEASEDT